MAGSWWTEHKVVPKPTEAIVHKRSKPTVPFGFRKGSGIDWTPAAPERRTRDEAMVQSASRQREDA